MFNLEWPLYDGGLAAAKADAHHDVAERRATGVQLLTDLLKLLLADVIGHQASAFDKQGDAYYDLLSAIAGVFQSDIDEGASEPAVERPDGSWLLSGAMHADEMADRLGIDEAMMAEISGLNETLKPAETLFVVDAMTGQDAANTAKAFGDALPLTGVVLTKVDGDARGGAALSVRQITGKPIKFLGVGEKLEALEPFHPDRVASRILGMGDVLSLVEEAEQKVDRQKAEKLAKKLQKGKGFDLNDLADQLRQMQEMGGLGALMEKMPGGAQMPKGMAAAADDTQVKRMLAIVDSMTPQERAFPDVIKASRKRRIAGGSGTQVQDINRLLKQHLQMRKMMKKFKGGGMKKMMRAMQGMGGGGGGMPPGMGGGGTLPPGMGR